MRPETRAWIAGLVANGNNSKAMEVKSYIESLEDKIKQLEGVDSAECESVEPMSANSALFNKYGG